MEETPTDAKGDGVNFISSMVAHRVMDPKANMEPESKEESKAIVSEDTISKANDNYESKVDDVNFISSMVSHKVVDSQSMAETNQKENESPVEPIKQEKELKPTKQENEVVANKPESGPKEKEADCNFISSMVAHRVIEPQSINQESIQEKDKEVKNKTENVLKSKPMEAEVKQNQVEDFNFISSMVAHRVIDPQFMAGLGKQEKDSKEKTQNQQKNDASKEPKTMEGEVKQNQTKENSDKETRNVNSGETAKKGKSKEPKQVSAETLAALEKSWDVSQDIELCKVLNKARMLAAAKPAPPAQQKQPPKFNISLEKIRRLPNPTSRIEASRATLHRNLVAYPNKDLSTSQRLEIERLIVKIMGVAYMPEDITGWYEYMSKKDPREQMKTFNKEVFYNSGDIRYREASVDEWKQGSGLYINNYENLIMKTNVKDHLKLTSAEEGHDIRSVVIRLRKAVGLIEEAIRSVTGKGFQHKGESFVHSNEHLYSHGFDLSLIVFYPGFFHEEEKLIKNTGIKLGLNVQKYGKRDGVYELTVSQKPDDSIEAILQRAVQGVDSLAAEEELLQKKHNINLDQLH